jgi:hypothetical protein
MIYGVVVACFNGGGVGISPASSIVMTRYTVYRNVFVLEGFLIDALLPEV